MSSSNHSLEVSQRIPAKRAKVFDAWTRPEKMGWYCPEDMTLTAANADVRIEGSFRATMTGGDGRAATVYGTYREIVPDRKIVFTHQWEGPAPVETLVTVTLEDRDGGTEVTVVQRGFADAETAASHEQGWASTLRNLARYMSKRELMELERRYWQAIKDRDADAAMALSDEPCIVAGASGHARIERKALGEMIKGAKYQLRDFRLEDDADVRLLGDDVAIVAYEVHEDLTVDGKPVSLDAADSSTWVRRQGRWLCALHTESLAGDPFGRDRSASARR